MLEVPSGVRRSRRPTAAAPGFGLALAVAGASTGAQRAAGERWSGLGAGGRKAGLIGCGSRRAGAPPRRDGIEDERAGTTSAATAPPSTTHEAATSSERVFRPLTEPKLNR
jgi:hypothetical protein